MDAFDDSAPHAQAPRPDLRGITSMAMRQVLADLAIAYRSNTGRGVDVESVGGVDAARRVAQGEAFDFVVLAADAIDTLARGGHVVANSALALARSGMAIAVAAGAPHPDIGSEPALRATLLAARSIGYSTGPSGRHLLALLERWDIAATVAPRLVMAAPGVAVGALVARGDAEIGVQQTSELLPVAGIDIVGALPEGAQQITVFSGAICAQSSHLGACGAWLRFAASTDAVAAKRRQAMEPA